MSRETLSQTIDHKGYRIELHYDHDAESPRDSCDNLGTLFYKDQHSHCEVNETGYQSLLRILELAICENWVFLPVFFHDYGSSGSGIKTDAIEMVRQRLLASNSSLDHTDDYDSVLAERQNGIIVLEQSKLIKEYGNDSAESRQQSVSVMISEIEELNRYYKGEVFGFMIYKLDAYGEVMDPETPNDSCWGFIGEEYCIEAAKEWIDCEVKAAKAKRQKRNRKRGRQPKLELTA